MKEMGIFVGLFVGAIVGSIFLGFLCSYFVMLLWNNCLVPAVDGIHTVGWLQAWGITILCSLLFKASITSK